MGEPVESVAARLRREKAELVSERDRLRGELDVYREVEADLRARCNTLLTRLASVRPHVDRLEAWCRDETRDDGQALGGIVADLRRAVDGQEE